jgi:hypothetical protein
MVIIDLNEYQFGYYSNADSILDLGGLVVSGDDVIIPNDFIIYDKVFNIKADIYNKEIVLYSPMLHESLRLTIGDTAPSVDYDYNSSGHITLLVFDKTDGSIDILVNQDFGIQDIIDIHKVCYQLANTIFVGGLLNIKLETVLTKLNTVRDKLNIVYDDVLDVDFSNVTSKYESSVIEGIKTTIKDYDTNTNKYITYLYSALGATYDLDTETGSSTKMSMLDLMYGSSILDVVKDTDSNGDEYYYSKALKALTTSIGDNKSRTDIMWDTILKIYKEDITPYNYVSSTLYNMQLDMSIVYGAILNVKQYMDNGNVAYYSKTLKDITDSIDTMNTTLTSVKGRSDIVYDDILDVETRTVNNVEEKYSKTLEDMLTAIDNNADNISDLTTIVGSGGSVDTVNSIQPISKNVDTFHPTVLTRAEYNTLLASSDYNSNKIYAVKEEVIPPEYQIGDPELYKYIFYQTLYSMTSHCWVIGNRVADNYRYVRVYKTGSNTVYISLNDGAELVCIVNKKICSHGYFYITNDNILDTSVLPNTTTLPVKDTTNGVRMTDDTCIIIRHPYGADRTNSKLYFCSYSYYMNHNYTQPNDYLLFYNEGMVLKIGSSVNLDYRTLGTNSFAAWGGSDG